VLSREELQELGYKLAIFPVAGLLASAAALHSVYGELRRAGSTSAFEGALYPFGDFTRLMGFERVWSFEREHAETQ
jgi:2-methylisocitrate lyase-like PEP mutase family enzyme